MTSLIELFSKLREHRYGRFASLAIIALLLLFSIYVHNMYLAILLGVFAWTLYRALRLAPQAGPKATKPSLEQGFAALERGNGAAVVEIASALTASATTDRERDEAAHLLAWGLYLGGDYSAALKTLEAMPNERDPDPALVGAIELELGRPHRAMPLLAEALGEADDSFVRRRYLLAVTQSGDFAEAARVLRTNDSALAKRVGKSLQAAAMDHHRFREGFEIGVTVFDHTADPNVAIQTAGCLARLGRPENALEWLRKAHAAGFSELNEIEGSADFETVRALPTWPAFKNAATGVIEPNHHEPNQDRLG